jgi:hypothetical protein
MSGNPNWNPPLQTSSVRFPRKAVETPQIPPNTTARPRPGAPFQPVYPNPITQIPAITPALTGSGDILDNLYVLSNGTGDAQPYNVTRQTIRGVPIPEVITIATSERYIVFGVDFPYRMSGTDHFVFTFVNVNTNEQTIKNYQQASQYLVGGIDPGVLYTMTVSPYVNGITYPASRSIGPFAITAISEKNVELQGVTLSGGDRSAYISFTGANPGPPIAMAVSNIAIDDNFINPQLRCNVISPSGVVNAGYVFISNLTNGSSYFFTVTPFNVTDGIYEYGRPTNLPPYIPGPPSDLYVNSFTANTTTAFLSTCYDTIIHPTPVSNTVTLYNSTFTTICSLVSQPSTVIQDLSQTYAGFTTSTSLFTPADITYLKSTVSANPGIIQVDITDNTGVWYSFPLASVSGGGIGYVFENSNFTKTPSLYTTASASYSLLFRQINLGTQVCSAVYSPPRSEFIYSNLFQSNYTVTGRNFANGLPSLRTTHATVAVGNPLAPTNITGISGNHIVSISFTGYDRTLVNPGPRSTFFEYNDNFGNTYTTLNPTITINGLTNGSSYTFAIRGFANGGYGNTAQYRIIPDVRPPSTLSVIAISNYDVTLSFSPALGGADYYAVATQNGFAESASASPYKIQGLSADVSYFFGVVSFAYSSAVYSVSSSISANLIQEVSSSYAQFLISPSGFPYVSNIQQGLTEFVPYLYTITASGQGPAPPTVNVTNLLPTNIFPVGTSLYASNSISTIALVQSGISAGIAYTVTTSGKISYALTSIGVSGSYYVLNGGPSSLTSVLSGQVLSLSITPISNSLTFPITSVAPVYNASGNITSYNVQNSNFLKSKVTFSGATIYRTSISALIPFYDGMTPTTFLGTVSSAVTPARIPPTFVGPPNTVFFTSSGYSSQEIFLNVAVSGNVVPLFYSYTELSGQVAPGTSVSSQIVFSGLTNGSSYTFSVRAFGNQVFSVCAAQTIRFDLCTNAPRNVVASFSNVTPTISYDTSIPASDFYVSDLFDGNTLIQTISNPSGGIFNFPLTVKPQTRYTFKTYGVRNGISSTPCNIFPKISGRPEIPLLKPSILTSGQIVFNWSSGNTDYSETFRITEYLSNNGVYPTGGVWSNISGFTYTVSAVVTTSATQGFAATEWIESSLGYAAFVLTNSYPNFTNDISSRYLSNQMYMTVQQSGGLTYTFPLTNIAPFNSQSNIYTNPNYPKEATDIFNAALSLSVTYSYGTGPFNYGKYFYTLDSFANQVYGLSAGIPAQMFVEPVNGVPTVTITGTAGTTATVSFAQTAITGSVYTVTNNYGSNVSAAPYAFTNLSTGRPYAFTVVVSNGAFISISSASSIPIYVGGPSAPLVSTSYYGQTSTVYVTDTTLSLASVFFDSGKQGTGSNIVTPSHTNVIQQVSGGFWVGTGGNGGIKDTSTGFVSSVVDIGSAVYCNDGVANAMYQFTVTPSTGTIAVSLSSYSLFISGTSLAVSNGSTQVYSATVTTSSYPIQFVSRSIAFGIQSGLSSFFYTSVPASSDLLTISLGGAASFSDYRVYSFNNAGVQASSYTITDQDRKVYNPTLAYTVYSLSGITYASNLFNVSQNVNLTLSVTPVGNGVVGPAGTASLFIYTEGPGTPFVASLVDTSATVTVAAIPPTALPVESYSLIEYENGIPKSTQTQPSTYSPYAVPGLSMWLDAADTSTITSNATTGITQWADKSTNGYKAVPALFTIPGCVVWINPGYYFEFAPVNVTSMTNLGTAGGSITTTAGTVTKIGVAYPSASYLSFPQGSSMSLPPITYTQTSRTVFVVVRVGAQGGVRQFLTAATNTTSIQFYSDNTNLELNLPGFRLERAPSPQNFFNSISILSATSTTADRGIYVNGLGQVLDIDIAGGAYPTGTTTTQVIGNTGAPFDLYEMMVFDGALTTAQRQQVEGYLAYKYNLQSRLPVSHPYSTTPFQRVFTSTITPPNITTTTQNNLNAIATNTGFFTVNNFNWTSYSTIFFVAKSPNISYFAGTAVSSYVGYIGTFNYGLFSTGVANFNDSVLPLGTQVIPSNEWCLFSIGYGGGTQATNYAVNGILRSTTTAPPGGSISTISPLWLSAWGPSSIYGGDNITIGEVIHYNRSITTQERQTIELYLANKWGLGLGPNSIPGLNLWLDAADTTTYVGPTTSLTGWRDKSDRGNNPTLFNSALAGPSVAINPNNGLPGLRFPVTSGAGTGLNNGNPFLVPNLLAGTSYSVIGVFQYGPLNGANNMDAAGQWKSYFNSGLTFASVGSNINVRLSATGPNPTSVVTPIPRTDTPNSPHIYAASISSSTTSANATTIAGIDGADAVYNTTVGPNTADASLSPFSIGSRFEFGTSYYPLTGYLHELIVFNQALTLEQLKRVESYLANKWRLTGSFTGPLITPPPPVPIPTSYTFRYPNLSNHSNYYFKAYTTRLDISSQNQPVSSPEREAGRPYPFSGLTASLINPNPTIGNYTLSATLNVGLNSNADMTVFVFSGNNQIASQTIASTTAQRYSFTVSGGAVYTLSSSALMNSVTQTGPTISIPAIPFAPLGASITISTADFGSTYRGIINVTTPSPTQGVTYYYTYSSNNGATVTIPLTTANTFTATYGLSYVGYVYSCNVAQNLLSTASAKTTTCNIFLPEPTGSAVRYNGTTITVTWSSDPLYLFRIREKNGQLPPQSNIPRNFPTVTFTGSQESNYTFEIATQSTSVAPSPSILYSTYVSTATITLTTLSAAPVTIDYTGSTITLAWKNLGANYIYSVSQTRGPAVTIPTLNPGQNTIDIINVSLSNTYQFVVGTLLNGISGTNTTSPLVTLSTVALTNVSQSIFGNRYTISWSPYPFSGITDYIVTELCSGQSFSTRTTVSTLTLTNTISLYTFQVNASYKGIQGPATTLSSVYTYVNATASVPTTTYSNSNITVTWSAAPQPDGNSGPNSYFVYDTVGRTLSSIVDGTINSVTLTASVGLSYQFTVTSIYKGLSSPPSSPGPETRVFTPSATNVVITNVGSNLFISWTPNTLSATYAIRQTLGPSVMSTTGFSNVGLDTSYTTNAVTTPSDKIFYRFEVLALSNGLSSAVATGLSAFVYTYPPTGVFIYYSNTQLFARWTPDNRQPNASFTVVGIDQNGFNIGGLTSAAGETSLAFQNGDSNSTYTARVTATNSGLVQSDAAVASTNSVKLFTAPPVFNGIGFNGNYAITANMSYGPLATDSRLRNADTYTLTETNNNFFPSASSWTISGSDRTVFTIPTLGTRGITYNFSLIATLCGLPSIVASPSGTIQLPLITNPVPTDSVVATYSGTTVTVTWGKAAQNNIGNANADPNGGYTIYVSTQAFPLATQYKSGLLIQFIGEPGETYQFSVEATNNNVGSALVTDASAVVTLYKPVVDFLTVTNSGATDNVTGRYYALMEASWIPDEINAPGAVYTGTSRNRTTGRIEQSLTTTSSTLIFNGSLDTTYAITVTGRYKGITGDDSAVQISNARPVLTVEPLFNLGNIITVNYSANQAFSSFDVSVRAVTPAASVLSNIITTSAFSSWRVTTSTAAFTYNISTTAFFNGIPSTIVGRQIQLIEPAAPTAIDFRYNNALVTVSWSSVTANASTYAFTAYDMSVDPPILADSQPGLFTRTATFIGILGHTYNVSAFAVSATNITSKGVGRTETIEIPSAPTGPLILSNIGTRVSVTWTPESTFGYSFYVSNVAQRGTVIYSNLFALPGDTFTGVVGETYSVSLFRTSASNVTSTDSIEESWKVYQPFIPFVTFTNVGQDNTVTWPQDVGGSNCVFSLRDNYLYSNLLFPDPTNYITPSNQWVNDASFTPTRIAGCSLWLDAADQTKIGRVSGAITTWTDKSTNGYVATKLEGTIGSTTLNNLSALVMGYNRMSIPNFVWTNSFTAFAVARVTSGSYMTGLTNPALSGGAAWLNYFQTGNWGLLYVGPTFATTDPDYRQPNGDPAPLPGTENWFIFTVGYNGGTTAQNFTFNGSPCNSTPGTATGLGSKTGTYYVNGLNTGGYGDCIVAELIHYNSNLNPLQMTQVTTYLANKWGLTMNPVFKQGPALIHSPIYNGITLSATYTQVGSFISYTVVSNEANIVGKPYIYTVIPSWNGTNGNTVTTNTTTPIQLYKPTAPGNGILSAVGQGSSFTINWQSSVIYTSPATTIIPSYLVEVSPRIPNVNYPYKSFNVVGNSQTVTNFDASAGTLSISVTAFNPIGYSNAIYGFPSSLDYIVPSGTTVSIAQSTLSAETLTVTVPQQTAGTNYMWLLAVGYGQTNAGVPSSTNVQSNRLNYKTDSRNYTLNVSLGFSYTISAFLTTGSASINDGPNGSSPANGIPFPVPTLPVAASGITVTHNACSVALSWPPVVGAEYYNVYYNPITAGGFGRANIPATTAPSITILSNGLLGQFGANSNYSYIIQAFSTSAYRFFGSGVRGCNLQSADSVSPVVTMFVPTNPAPSQLTFSQQLSNLTISWPALTNYPQDNEADIGTPLYTISAGSLTCNATTGRTATFVISPGTNYPITLNTQYKGLWGATPTTTSYLTTAPTITVAPLLTNTGLATIRVTATAATVGFWYLLEGTTETLMNSPAAVASNAITAYTFPIVKATIYARQVKFVTQDTGLSVTSNTNTVTTPNLVVSIPTTADAGATRQFSITLGIASGTPIGGVVWNVTTPVGTTFLSGSTTTYPTTLTYQFTNAAWSSGLAATFTSIVLSNNGFTFPYTGANPTFTAPNLAITGVTLLNEGGAGNLILRASNAFNVTWTYPSYTTLGGGGSATTTALSNNYGAISATGTIYSPNAALTLTYNGYTNSISLPSFTAPNFGFGTITFAEAINNAQYTSPTNNILTVPGGATNPTVIVTVIGGGGGSAPYGGGYAPGGNGAVATYTFTNLTLTTPITYFVGRGGTYPSGGGWNSYVIIGSTKIYAGGGGGAYFGEQGQGDGGGGSGGYNGYEGSISPIAAVGTRIGTYGNSGFGFNQSGNSGIVVISIANYTSIRLTANWSITSAGSWTGATTSTWGFPATTSNGGGGANPLQLSTTGNRNPTTNGAFVDYSTTARGSNYAIAANQISLNYAGVTAFFTSNRTAQSGNPTVTGVTSTNVGGTITLTGTGTAGGVWSGSTPAGLSGPTVVGNVLTYTGAVTGQTYNFNVFVTATGFTSPAFPHSVTILAVNGLITSTTLTFGTGNPPIGINTTFTANFTPNSTSNIVVLYDTPLTNVFDGRYNGQTQTLTGLTTTFNNGTLNPNIVYRIGAAQSINGNRGTIAYRNIVYPAAVTNVVWGSAAGSSDRSLATSNTIWISWTPITVNSSIASRFTYTLYASSTPPGAPSSNVPAGAIAGQSGLLQNRSNTQFTIPGSGGTFYLITRYADPDGYSYYSAASAIVRFTYGSVTYTSGTTTFGVAGARTFANMTVVGAGGGSGNAGNLSGTGSGGGGGYVTLNGYRGIQQGDSIFVTAGGGGANGTYDNASTATGGRGGSANGVAGNAGTTNGNNGANNNPNRGTGIGGGGGSIQRSYTPPANCP